MPRALFYTGSCNRPVGYVAEARGAGISAFWLDTESAEVTPAGVTQGIDNPTFVAIDPTGAALAAVSEVEGWNEGLVTAYVIDRATGTLTYGRKQPTHGDTPAHIGFDNRGRYVGVANYTGEKPGTLPGHSVALYRLRPEGELSAPLASFVRQGSGPNTARQDRPHAHCLRFSPDNRFALVTDLGTDCVITFRFNPESGALEPSSETPLPPGAGPRHLVFHPRGYFVYVANELDLTVATFAYDQATGRLTLAGTTSTMPRGYAGDAACSAIVLAPNGRSLFVGNRFHNSIARLDIDPMTGLASFVSVTPSGGAIPRDFAFDPTGSILAVANTDSHRVNMFRYDAESGDITLIDKAVETGAPTAIAFHPALD